MLDSWKWIQHDLEWSYDQIYFSICSRFYELRKVAAVLHPFVLHLSFLCLVWFAMPRWQMLPTLRAIVKAWHQVPTYRDGGWWSWQTASTTSMCRSHNQNVSKLNTLFTYVWIYMIYIYICIFMLFIVIWYMYVHIQNIIRSDMRYVLPCYLYMEFLLAEVSPFPHPKHCASASALFNEALMQISN